MATLFASVALAGGVSWKAKVLSISPPGTAPVTLVIEPLENSRDWAGCPKVTVISTLHRETIGFRTWSASLDQEKYDAALAALRDAAARGATIRLGSMGSGLKPASDKCKLLSRGLEVLKEPSGSVAIYSYHDPI